MEQRSNKMNDVSEAGGNRETSEGEVEQAMGDERMVRSDVLSRANLLITGDRAKQYGSAGENFNCIATMWTAYLGRHVSAYDVANMMALLKIARMRNGVHQDSSVDGCGYLALAYELSNQVT
jgi:hypothetical protein